MKLLRAFFASAWATQGLFPDLVILLDGRLVIAMMLCEVVLRGVTVNQELGMPVFLVLVNVLGRGQRQQAEPQAEHARDDRGHPHASIVCDAG